MSDNNSWSRMRNENSLKLSERELHYMNKWYYYSQQSRDLDFSDLFWAMTDEIQSQTSPRREREKPFLLAQMLGRIANMIQTLGNQIEKQKVSASPGDAGPDDAAGPGDDTKTLSDNSELIKLLGISKNLLERWAYGPGYLHAETTLVVQTRSAISAIEKYIES